MKPENDDSEIKFGFDHCGNTSQNAADFFSLGERGFDLSPHEFEHPGTYHCRFIIFNNPNPMSGSNQRKRQYLEFCEVKELEEAQNYYVSIGVQKEEIPKLKRN